jgi:phosphate transport system substrate-binding protein
MKRRANNLETGEVGARGEASGGGNRSTQRAWKETQQLKRTRIVALTLGALAVSGAGGVTSVASAQSGSLVGAGSTLVAPLMTQWSNAVKGQGLQVTYGAVGSGAGIQQITSRTVDFGASDAPLTPEQAAACHGCVQIPWALSATGVAFHINGVKRLKLTSSLIARIYQGKIVNWNDRRIKAANKKVKLPNLAITPVFRSDGSGDTYAFTDYLSRTDAGWKRSIGVGTQVSFPKGVGGKGNDGMSAVIGSTNGSIGYVSAAYIIAHLGSLYPAQLKNAAGHFVYPNYHNIQAAGKTVRRVPRNNEMHIVNPSKKAALAYPLSTFTYAIVPTSSPKAALIKRFIDYAMTTGQKFGPALDFARIPKVVLKASRRTLNRIH